jgi:hypothetical protein
MDLDRFIVEFLRPSMVASHERDVAENQERTTTLAGIPARIRHRERFLCTRDSLVMVAELKRDQRLHEQGD